MRVVLADDSVLLREGIAQVLGAAGFEVVGQAGDANELLRLVAEKKPDVAVVDIRMPPTHREEGIEAAREIRSKYEDVAVLVLSQFLETGYAMKVVSDGGGGLGYLLKDRVSNVEQLKDAIRRVAAGETVIDPEIVRRLVQRQRDPGPLEDLSQREREVLAEMAEGRSNRAISQRLVLSERTVEAHVASIFMRLGLAPAADDHRRVLAVLAYLRS